MGEQLLSLFLFLMHWKYKEIHFSMNRSGKEAI